jgi:hypothetical protein
MGIGLTALYARVPRRPALICGLTTVATINWAATFHYVPTRTREAVEAQADTDFVARCALALPEGSLVVSPDPCMWMLQGRNASQFFTINEMLRHEMRELTVQYPGGIYVHWSFWHNAEPAMARETAELLAATNATTFLRERCQAYTLALLRVDTPEGLARFGGKPPAHPPRDTDLDTLLGRAKAQLATPAPSAPAAVASEPPAK